MKHTSVNKRIFIRALAAMMVAAAFLLGSLKAFAAVGPLVTLESSMDITIIVGYDTEKPQVVFVSPSNKRYEKAEDFDEVIEADMATYYYISSASSGDWTVEYEKGKNKEITIDVLPWHKNISIEKFSFTTQAADDKPLPEINGALTVNYGNNFYKYIISAVKQDADGNITNRIELYQGSGYGSSEETFSVYPELLMDGEYTVQAEVYGEDGTGVEVRDSVIAEDKLTITGNTAQGKDECLEITCNITDGTVDIDFDSSAQECRCDEYAFIVLQGDVHIAEQLYTEENFSEHIIFDPADGDITVQINAKDRDTGYISWSRTFKPVLPISLEIETEELTNAQTAIVSFDAGEGQYPGSIMLGEEKTDIVWNGKNTAQIALHNLETNELVVRVEDNNVCYYVTKTISVDTMPPYIDIYGAESDMVTSEDSVKFVGKTDAEELSCNGEKIDCAENGSFSIVRKMDEDEKEFIFEAADSAGNITKRTIRVTRKSYIEAGKKKEKKGIMPLLITMGIAFLMAALTAGLSILLIKRKEKKGVAVKPVPAVIGSFAVSAAVTLIGVGVWQLIMHLKLVKELTGENFVKLLKNSTMTEVAAKIDDKKNYLTSSIISFSVAAGLIIILIVISIIKKKAQKKKKVQA
ncbi:MAG: hypothetical protein IJJ74_08740 [Eubacterium sp.]|nr:hypothetical protein [Eubacterium sp.]